MEESERIKAVMEKARNVFARQAPIMYCKGSMFFIDFGPKQQSVSFAVGITFMDRKNSDLYVSFDTLAELEAWADSLTLGGDREILFRKFNL